MDQIIFFRFLFSSTISARIKYNFNSVVLICAAQISWLSDSRKPKLFIEEKTVYVGSTIRCQVEANPPVSAQISFFSEKPASLKKKKGETWVNYTIPKRSDSGNYQVRCADARNEEKCDSGDTAVCRNIAVKSEQVKCSLFCDRKNSRVENCSKFSLFKFSTSMSWKKLR